MAGWNKHQQKIVDQVIADWKYLIHNESIEWYYSARPYARPTRAEVHNGHTFSNDCTGTIKLINVDWNGIKSFDGQPSGYGDTLTFSKAPRAYHLQLDPRKFQPLDIILYKNHSGPFHAGAHEHATQLLYECNGVWFAGSMGSNSGPKREQWNYRNDVAMAIRIPIPAK